MFDMDKYEKRRLRLMQIRDEMCGGKAVDVARKIEREPSPECFMMRLKRGVSE